MPTDYVAYNSPSYETPEQEAAEARTMSKKGYNRDVLAAWQDGYDARKEEENPSHPGIDQLAAVIKDSLLKDRRLAHHQVRAIWDDAFLTNVIVPHLEHIREWYREREDHYLKQKSLSPTEVKEFQEVLHKVNAITTTVHILQEWRG